MPEHLLNRWSLSRLLLVVALVLLVIATLGAFAVIQVNYAGVALFGFCLWLLALIV